MGRKEATHSGADHHCTAGSRGRSSIARSWWCIRAPGARGGVVPGWPDCASLSTGNWPASEFGLVQRLRFHVPAKPERRLTQASAPVGGHGHQFRLGVDQPELRVSSGVSPRLVVLPCMLR